jgi:GTP cyclohydrolase II
MALAFCAFFNASKHGEFDFLSNFYEGASTLDATLGEFHTAEGLYQYLKCADKEDGELRRFFQAATGQQAWDVFHGSVGVPPYSGPIMVSEWDKVAAMTRALRAKFSAKEMADRLLGTGSAYLVENCPPGHDSFWADNGDGTGENRLGRVLMELRAELGGVGVVSVPDKLLALYRTKCDVCGLVSHFTNSGLVYNKCDQHMDRELRLGDKVAYLPLSLIPDGTGRFLYFSLNDMPEFVEEGALLIHDRLMALGLHRPVFLAPETSTFALAHVLRTKYGMEGHVLSKRRKPSDMDVVYSVQYCAVTSLDTKTLHLSKAVADTLVGRDLVIVDNVCTTGETIRAVYKLLCMAGCADRLREAIVLFTEGEDLAAITVATGVELPVHRFTHIPIFPMDPEIDSTLFQLASECTLPTCYGKVQMCVFRHRSVDLEAVALVSLRGELDSVPVRVHDACITSEAFHSFKCDCKLQLDQAQEFITKHGGIVIYLKQEGRGIGLANKIAAYNLQESLRLDTVEANRALGLPDDMREYTAARDILAHFKVRSVRLMTNNPRKRECLEKLGVKVEDIMPCVVKPQSEHMARYMKTKTELMGHTIPDCMLFVAPTAPDAM